MLDDRRTQLRKKQVSRAIIVKDRKILLMHRIKLERNYYTLIGGKIEKDESPEDALVREVKEETSFDVLEFQKVFEFEYDKRYAYYFIVKKFSGVMELKGPESKKNSPENQYILEWVEFEKFDEINLMNMSELKEKIRELLKNI